MKTLAIAINTFREALRNKILYSVVFFSVVLIVVAALFGNVTIGDQVRVIKDFGLFSLSFCGAIIAIISGVSLLNKEIKQKTIYNILSKPVERWQFILGKHIGLSLTVCLLVSIMGITVVIFTAFFEKKIDPLLFQAIYMTLLEVIVISAVAIFFSSIVITITLAGLFTLATYIAGRSIEYLTFFTENAKDPNPIILKSIQILDWILPDLNIFNVADIVAQGVVLEANHYIKATLYCLAYSTFLIIIASMIFNKRELK